jgi:hypothetical protein
MKEIGKTKKENEKENKKTEIVKRPRGNHLAQPRLRPTAHPGL